MRNVDKITAWIGVTASPGRQQDILKSFRSVLALIRMEPGCLGCSLFQDAEDELRIHLFQEWLTGEDLDRHILSSGYRTILSIVELSAEPPEISFDTVSEHRGLEYLEAVRLNASDGNDFRS